MKNRDRAKASEKAKWALEAMGVAVAYLGAFALLMYPVVVAAGSMPA
jgi:hypothetical protein